MKLRQITDFFNLLKERMYANFSLLDYGLLKLYGAIFGIIIGAIFSDYFKTLIIPLLFVFAILAIHFIFLLTIKASPKNT